MIKLRKPNSAFYRWWNSYSGKRIVSATYSLGASIVILGAMFKILHLPMGSLVLGVGMSVEVLVFALGIFDKPFREFDWSKIFNFKIEEGKQFDLNSISTAVQGGVHTAFTQPPIMPEMDGEGATAHYPGGYYPPFLGYGGAPQGGVAYPGGESGDVPATTQAGGFSFSDVLSEEDVQKLSDGIKNLSNTAEQLQKLSYVALVSDGLAENIEMASEMAGNFAQKQKELNEKAEELATSYRQVFSEMDSVVGSTKNYSGNVNEMSTTIHSIGSMYEMQLKQLQEQMEAMQKATKGVGGIAGGMDKMKEITDAAHLESQRYYAATRKLSEQVEDLNAVYGNMLNALS